MQLHSYDAREVMNNAGSRYAPRNQRNGANEYFGLNHDPMTAINSFDHDRHQSSLSNLPIPVGKY